MEGEGEEGLRRQRGLRSVSGSVAAPGISSLPEPPCGGATWAAAWSSKASIGLDPPQNYWYELDPILILDTFRVDPYTFFY